MARQRDPRRDEAKRIWLESNGEKQLKEIASELNVSDSQVRKWKSQDKWSAELKSNVTNGKSNVTNGKSNVTNQGGAPIGNQNAKGNKGNSRASPPVGNKNALKTGEYETIFFETLSDEEKDIYSSLNDNPSFVLSEEIRLLKIRQFRMMKRIQQAEAGLNDEEVERLQQLRKIKNPIEKNGKKLEIKREVMQDVQISRKKHRKIDDILSIEDSLTRISNQLAKAIKQMNELYMNEYRTDLIKAQTDKIQAETNEIGGNNSGEEIEEWKQAVLNAANKRAVKENE
ncbi:TPA: small subunit of terminase [Enterococcus faecium]|nr:small subunit of terminase [Enterococcus faecium]HBM6487723.1 small subunit of terminase [Enterococcus faecium]HBM6851817.1 small subunit of terminase [Enterococcus faecium]HBM7080598.1 small subunit of terminase [Enterococcus faecium]